MVLIHHVISTIFDKVGKSEEIVCDPERFSIIQKGLKLIASKRYPPREIYQKMYEDGLRTKRGKKLAYSVFYRILTSPFYYGLFQYPNLNGKWYEGKHVKSITESEYEAIQEALGRKDRERPHKHFFPYSGLMKCGECGCSIIADPKRKVQKNGNIHEYIYYHCTKKRGECNQKCLEVKDLEKQFTEVIEKVEIPDFFHNWGVEKLKESHEYEMIERSKTYENVRTHYEQSVKKLHDLVEGWLNKKIPEDIYLAKLPEYEKEKRILKKRLDNFDDRIDEWIKNGKEVLKLCSEGADSYINRKPEKKKQIVMSLGSNLILKDKKVDIDVQKPLVVLSERPANFDVVIQTLEPLDYGLQKAELNALVCENPFWGE